MIQNFFLGIVENRYDPLMLGRVQVRVFGVHTESLDDVPTSALPWAIPLMPATSASISGIGHSGSQYIEGSQVFLFFQDGESKQQPVILGGFHGIPVNQSPFGATANQGSVPANSAGATVTSSVKPASTTESADTAGTPVEKQESDTSTSAEVKPPVDISKMVAKFGSNVTLVYNELLNFGIKEPNAIVAILCNVAKECKFKPRREGMQYKSIARLKEIYPKYFSNMADADIKTYVNNEQKLANYVYANRYGNGNTASGDGYAFRGGGFIQLTFKSNYSTVGSKIGVDFISSPEKIDNPNIAAKAVAQFFINNYGGAARVSFSSLDAALTGITKKVNSGGFARDYPIVKGYAPLCKIIVDDNAAKAKKDESVAEKPNNPENDVKEDATKKEIDNGLVNGNASGNDYVGFSDPSKKYPLTTFLNEQDTNRLARRNTSLTYIKNRVKKRRMEIRSIGSSFNEPAPAYNAQYPYNHVYATESGHVQEFDDTPGRERIQTYHNSGTYQEIDTYGNRVNKIIGDDFTIVERNGYIYIDGTARLTVGSDVKIVIKGNLDIEVDGNVNYDVGGDVTWKVGGDLKYGVAGKNSISSGGNTDIDSPNVNLNSGTAESIGHSSRSGTTNDYALQIPENFIDAEIIDFDDGDHKDGEAFQKRSIEAGTMTQKQVDDGHAEAKAEAPTENKAPTNTPNPLPVSCAMFAGKTEIPDSTQLSKYFTVGMLSSKAAVTSDKVQAQQGLSLGEIVCNMKNLAENCLDVIKAKYPKMLVTSCFRKMGSNPKSQHPLGMACDMQFGVGKSELFDICVWIKDNVLYDQLLMEYKTTGTGNPWIHISFNSRGNRKQVLTFMNNKTAAQGLKKLQS